MAKKREQINFMDEVDRYEIEREKREEREIIKRLDENYQRITARELDRSGLPAGTVVIIKQELFRNNHYTSHFYRSILNYHEAVGGTMTDLFAAPDEEWPYVVPWAGVVNRLDYHKHINPEYSMMYWTRHEVVEPIELN